MIVKDAAVLLPACLESVKSVVDEMVVVDTGSTDNTIAIAQNLGAKVLSIPWKNNFAEARNHSLAEVKSDWVLSLDADEQLDPTAISKIPALLENVMVAGYQVTIRNYVLSLRDRIWDRPAEPNQSSLEAARPYPAYVEHENVRLFRRDAEIYFVGRVHESVGTRILASGKKLGHADFFIHHFGLVADQETRARKNRFYRELGQQKIKEMPGNAQAYFELGLVEMDNFGNFSEARDLFEQACKLNPQSGSAWFFQGMALFKLNSYADALRCLAEAERLGHRTAIVAETRGDAHYNLGEFTLAQESYSMALRRDPKNSDIESKLGLALVRIGTIGRGLQRLRHSVSLHQVAPESHDRLILALVFLNQPKEAANAAEDKIRAVEKPTATDFLRAASLWAKVKDWQQAWNVLKTGLDKYPDDHKLQQGLAEANRSQIHHDLVSTTKS